MLIFRPGGNPPEVRTFTRAPTLAELKDGIGGGCLEPVPGFRTIGYLGVLHRCVAFADEHGKVEGYDDGAPHPLPLNMLAAAAWDLALHHDGQPSLLNAANELIDHLVGDIAVVFGDDEFMESL
jgi:hypothetical protein